ncbi:hypothetical protein BD779DRAFT_1473944 [Infundibulicybe gibba]|nr:hypothetical protein BD779DRAFT_1473944 [Infundibulicybe gibba]
MVQSSKIGLLATLLFPAIQATLYGWYIGFKLKYMDNAVTHPRSDMNMRPSPQSPHHACSQWHEAAPQRTKTPAMRAANLQGMCRCLRLPNLWNGLTISTLAQMKNLFLAWKPDDFSDKRGRGSPFHFYFHTSFDVEVTMEGPAGGMDARAGSRRSIAHTGAQDPINIPCRNGSRDFQHFLDASHFSPLPHYTKNTTACRRPFILIDKLRACLQWDCSSNWNVDLQSYG